MFEYDLIVIGSGPAGEMAAVQAGFLGKRVLLIERESILGGAAANTGTIPSKTLRETALFLAGFRQRSLFGLDISVSLKHLTACEFLFRERHVAEQEREKIRTRLEHQQIEIMTGTASFTDDHSIRVALPDGESKVFTSHTIMVATGSRPYRPDTFASAGKRVYDSTTILDLEQFPDSMIVVGAGVIGCEYACIFASLGVEVTLVHGQNTLLPFLDGEIQSSLEKALLALGITLVKPERVIAAEEVGDQVSLTLESGGTLEACALLLATGRSSNTNELGLETTDVVLGKRGLIEVNTYYQTDVPHIYAAGDVIGFPALASTSIEQGRISIKHAFGPKETEKSLSLLQPYGIYTIPECAMVGETEEQLQARNADYVVGIANYGDNARGLIIGEEFGLLKLLFDRATRRLLGVHIIGEQATELVHTGVMALNTEATADHFLHSSFNYPTLSELYKHAAYQAFGKPSIE